MFQVGVPPPPPPPLPRANVTVVKRTVVDDGQIIVWVKVVLPTRIAI